MILFQKISTPLGIMTACSSLTGICRLGFDTENKPVKGNPSGDSSEVLSEGSNEHLVMLKQELAEYFEGKRKVFSVPLDLQGTAFQNEVWKELMRIEYGETRTYLEQSNALGNPRSIRAVAHANGMNPVAIVIPCHRVIGSNGTLTGYAGGLERKKWLLEHERKFSGRVYDLSLF